MTDQNRQGKEVKTENFFRSKNHKESLSQRRKALTNQKTNHQNNNHNRQATNNRLNELKGIKSYSFTIPDNKPSKKEALSNNSDLSNQSISRVEPKGQRQEAKSPLTNQTPQKNDTRPEKISRQYHPKESNSFFDRLLKKRKARKQERQRQFSLKGLPLKEKISIIVSVILNVLRKVFIYFVIFGLLVGFFAGGIGLGYFTSLVSKTTPPSKQEMAEAINQIEQQSSLYYGNGDLIADVRSDVVRSVTSLDEVSPFITKGLIAIEDQAFYEHPGVNPKSTLRAILQTLLSGTGTGGSTLTQQLVKQQLLTNDVTFFRKANEILLALRLEKYFTKDEILNAYLNVSPFGRNNMGDNIAGIREASEGIFGKEPSEVNLPQAAFLVGLPQDPYNYTPYRQSSDFKDDFEAGVNRMRSVLFAMYRNKSISKEEYDQALQYDITKDFILPENRPAERQSYLYQTIMNEAVKKIMEINVEEQGLTMKEVSENVDQYNQFYFDAQTQLRTSGYQVYSTIDREIYDQLQESAQTYRPNLGINYDGIYVDPQTGEEIYYLEKVQTGIVVIENATGKVLGFVAGTDFENNQIDHAFVTRRSPGSTIKPLAVYAPAIENNLISPATIIPDTRFVETYYDGTQWEPTNYGETVSGKFLSARESLAKSLNLPTIRIYQGMLQEQVPVYEYLKLMGFESGAAYDEEEVYNLAFSIGGVNTGPTVFEQTSAFTTFANDGYYIQGHIISKIVDSYGNVVFEEDKPAQKVFSEDTNYLMIDILRDTTDFGSGQYAKENLQVPGDWIAKSGTSENAKDVWFIASTPTVTIGTWAGYDSQYYEYFINTEDGLGNEGIRSQVFWANIVNELYATRPDIFGTDQVFTQPASVVSQGIVTSTGTLPGTMTTNDNRVATINGPYKDELFKVSNPAPELTYDFMYNASKEDTALFWHGLLTSLLETTSDSTSSSDESTETTDTTDEDISIDDPYQTETQEPEVPVYEPTEVAPEEYYEESY